MSGPAGPKTRINFKTNLLAYAAKQRDKNKHMALDDWISQIVV